MTLQLRDGSQKGAPEHLFDVHRSACGMRCYGRNAMASVSSLQRIGPKGLVDLPSAPSRWLRLMAQVGACLRYPAAASQPRNRADWMQRSPALLLLTLALAVGLTVGSHEMWQGHPVLAAGWWLLAPLIAIVLLFAGLQRVIPGDAGIDLRAAPKPVRRPRPHARRRARRRVARRRARDSVP